MPACVVLQ